MNLFARNLNKYGQLVDLQSRSTTGATVGEPDPDQVFVTDFSVLSIVSTPIANGVPRGVVGEVVFDNIDTENSPTHKFVIAFLSDISQEVWVLFKGKRYDVMSVINCCEVDNTLILLARLRGPNTLAAASG